MGTVPAGSRPAEPPCWRRLGGRLPAKLGDFAEAAAAFGARSRVRARDQRLQVAVYQLLARSLVGGVTIDGIPLGSEDVECVVARIDEATNEGQAIRELPALDVTQEEADVRRLLGDNGPLSRIIGTPLDQLDYQLDSKCDSCVFDVHCYPESASTGESS